MADDDTHHGFGYRTTTRRAVLGAMAGTGAGNRDRERTCISGVRRRLDVRITRHADGSIHGDSDNAELLDYRSLADVGPLAGAGGVGTLITRCRETARLGLASREPDV